MAMRALDKLQTRRRIGDVLVEMGSVTAEQIDEILKTSKPGGPRLGTHLN